MQTNILFTGREYYSLENCLISKAETGWEIESSIVGRYENKIYLVEYIIRTDLNWRTLFFDIKSRHSNTIQHLSYESDGGGNWSSNRRILHEFKNCIDIDIPLTPFTNTLPINRLKLESGQRKEISVIYIDLLNNKITPVTQQYVRLSTTKYHYENVPNDFEADIEVDQDGYVIDYPQLFVRTAAMNTSYPKIK